VRSFTAILADALQHVLALLGVVADLGFTVRQSDVERLIDAVHVMDTQALELLRS